MAVKSPKRLMLESSLADEPTDNFLRYGLAVQCLRDGDVEEGRKRLKELIADVPEDVPAYQQLGQSFHESGDLDEAREAFREGIARAHTKGDAHAEAEMQGMLTLLG